MLWLIVGLYVLAVPTMYCSFNRHIAAHDNPIPQGRTRFYFALVLAVLWPVFLVGAYSFQAVDLVRLTVRARSLSAGFKLWAGV